MVRYAVLRDLDDPELRPIALVTEHRDAVRAHWAIECGLRSSFAEPYRVAEPNGEMHAYGPGTREYFDHVLATLGRTFVVDEVNEVPVMEPRDIVDLYIRKVAVPRGIRRAPYQDDIAPRARATAYGEQEHGPELVGATVGDDFLPRAA
jgi:hypothetical protein